MILKRDYNLDISNLKIQDHLWNEMTSLRARFEMAKRDSTNVTTLSDSGIWVCYINMPMILTRVVGIKEGKTWVEDGIAFYEIPTNPEKTIEIKHGGRVILTPDVMLLMLYHKNSSIASEEAMTSLQNHVEDIVAPLVQGKVTRAGNDMHIDGKKFTGLDVHATSKGVFATVPITLKYAAYSNIFEKYLEYDRNHLNSKNKITGVFDESTTDMTKDQFADIMIRKLQTYMEANGGI